MDASLMARLKQLGTENPRLKKMYACAVFRSVKPVTATIERVIPPAEFEQAYYDQLGGHAIAA